MTTQLHELSELELAAMIGNAQKALREKQDSKRKEGMAKIREIAASCGLTVEIADSPKPSSQKGGKVPVKYQNPANPSNQWTGRGMRPKWLRELVEQGHQLEEFAV
ncbi:MAG: H-NS family nucleoid-associated regulatory protein [Candidatus Methylumidiphilus sp.]